MGALVQGVSEVFKAVVNKYVVINAKEEGESLGESFFELIPSHCNYNIIMFI